MNEIEQPQAQEKEEKSFLDLIVDWLKERVKKKKVDLYEEILPG